MTKPGDPRRTTRQGRAALRRLISCVAPALAWLPLTPACLAQAPKPPSQACPIQHATPLNEMDKAFADRDYPRAEQRYAGALAASANSVPAMTGLVRSQLAQLKLADALASAKKFDAAQPNNADLILALGEVRFRRGEMEEAIAAYRRALKLDLCNPRLYFDISRAMELAGNYATARRDLQLAHQLAPDDRVFLAAWNRTQAVPPTLEQRIASLTRRLEDPALTQEQKDAAQASIKALQSRERGDCTIVRPVAETSMDLVPIANGPSYPLYAVGLDLQLNGHRKRFELDTGASGLLISKSAAASAGLVAEAETKAGGIGDDGPTGAFMTHVDDLKIGELEFHNCMVRVLERRSALEVDGLIGADVFRDYLVTIDTPSRKLRLAPLPKRPDDAAPAPGALETAGDEAATAAAPPVPRDTYIPPEMKSWTRIYRVGHQLIVPTSIGNAPSKLFILDTGASHMLISPEAAREVTKVYDDDFRHIKGISGQVKNVFEAGDITIQFANVKQLNRGMASIDTSGISRNTGIEISGFIGFPTLSELILSIDYRDNLIHVVYDPAHGFHAR